MAESIGIYDNYYAPVKKNGHKTHLLNDELEVMKEFANDIGDDRNRLQPHDKVLLIVEDDILFAKILIDQAHKFDLKTVVATNYGEVFYFANTYNPIAVSLDVKLPDVSGWRILDLFKNDLNLRHIPIHILSAEENKLLAYRRGARSFLLKPVKKNEQLTELYKDIVEFSNKQVRELLVIEDNKEDSSKITKLFSDDNGILVTIATTGKQAIQLWKEKTFDCVILDYMLPDISVHELMKEMNTKKQLPMIPVVIHSAKDFNVREISELKKIAHSIILKNARSYEEFYKETVKYLHLNHKKIPIQKRGMIEKILQEEDILKGKNILIVDDDVRNLFALTTAFERYGINPITAESGKEAINILNNPSNTIDLVLMDIMMPEMDGYETTQKIRRENKNNTLPIIAVTAKAMKGDRQKCIEAGASDYITKPVKIDQLMCLMRIWLYK